ncbi:oxalate decarboxylase [Terriglobus roseus]|uniref:Oxalate decarboxylase n=2 Tax=Terriglobus roseus TaxID=392734 RepID=A0A1H4KTZ5_9BACT|nr:oxalate decarboxylase [Terriglobus roseus]
MQEREEEVSRRKFMGSSAAALAAAFAAPVLAQDRPVPRSADHHLPNEEQPLRRNMPIENESPSSVWAPETDNGTVEPFWYSFSLAHKRITDGGWTRQVTSRELPVSKRMAGVEMRLIKGGVRELHWHVSSEWAFMISGSARITAVDAEARSHVSDVNAGDLWLFPGGVPHSIQGIGDDGCMFLLVFDQGDFDEFSTFLLTDFMAHTPKEVLAKNFGVPESTFDKVPKKELFIFAAEPPRPLADETREASASTGVVPQSMTFYASKMPPTKTTPGGEVRIIDNKNFPITTIAAAIVRLKPGGLRELHWHPLSDEWQYYVSGKGRMTVFEAGAKARTFDFQQGDVGYIGVSRPHYIENTGDEDLVFLEVFPISTYQDIALAEWLAHTPSRLVNEHIQVGEEMLHAIPKTKVVVDPA